ncbi:MAG TPA: secondary thiamine-phosphate synthase enzyme YjbQ [Sedimentisphaerales bacterium]|nr:secondary thiamine-phosphate synthase enzyme YjbQ [Sedimentisphaerales bacterium]
MTIVQEHFRLSTKKRNEMIDITSQVGSIVRQSGISDGDVLVYCPHTTAAITINENADPSVPHDILLTLQELIPDYRAGYRHSEGNSDAHAKSAIVGSSRQIPIKDKSLQVGTWQGIFFCEFDGPRSRKVVVQVRGE